MGDTATCSHAKVWWRPSPHDEAGWMCVGCGIRPGEPPGFSPQHDRDLLVHKAEVTLLAMHDAEIIHVSNRSEGLEVARLAAEKCRERDAYDSASIARAILDVVADDRHTAYWRDISNSILAGNDPRPRCSCGKLATVWQSGGRRTCGEHDTDWLDPGEVRP